MKLFLKRGKKHIKFFLTFTIIIFILLLLFKLYRLGILTDSSKLYDYLGNFAFFAPLVFIILKLFIGLIPFIPNTIFVIIGFALFGEFYGFLLNYITALLTGLINFSLTRIYGKKIMYKFLSKKSLHSYERIIYQSKKGFEKLFFITCLIPFLPDNALSLVAGLRKTLFRDYFKILIFGKFIEALILLFLIYNLKLIMI